MDHVRPAQLIVVPAGSAGRLRMHGPGAALEVELHLKAVRSAGHVRAGRLEVPWPRPDVRPSRHQASPPPTAGGGTHYHYFRGGGRGY